MKNNNKGIGLIIVLSAITLLSILMISFTYESKINVINSNNMQSRSQAKLNAEAGLRWSLLMFNIYRELFNKIEVNDTAKKTVPSDTLNIIWNTPFMFPVPNLPKSSINQKSALADFNNNNFLTGEMNVSVKNLSGKLNLNLLRFSVSQIASQEKLNTLYDGDYYEEQQKGSTFSKQFKDMLDNIIKAELEDEDNDDTDELEGLDTQELVDNIIYYTTDPVVASAAPCPTCADSQQNFNSAYLVAKKAPLTSLSELYLIPGWTDKLVKLIKNHVTVHGAIVIDLNEITAEILKLMMPYITKVEIDEFYEYKNNPDTLETFDKIETIKKYFTSNTDVSSSDFDKQVEELQNSGITFGSTASLFEVTSVGEVDRSTYRITAIVSLPPLPTPIGAPPKAEDVNKPDTGLFGVEVKDEDNDNEQEKKKKETYEYPNQLLKPRVIHFSIN